MASCSSVAAGKKYLRSQSNVSDALLTVKGIESNTYIYQFMDGGVKALTLTFKCVSMGRLYKSLPVSVSAGVPV